MSLAPWQFAAAIMIVSILATSCESSPGEASETQHASTAGAKEAVFEVDGMTCVACNIKVKRAVKDVPGVRQVRASFEEGRAWISYNPEQTNPNKIAAAITAAGYEAALAKPTKQ